MGCEGPEPGTRTVTCKIAAQPGVKSRSRSFALEVARVAARAIEGADRTTAISPAQVVVEIDTAQPEIVIILAVGRLGDGYGGEFVFGRVQFAI